MGALDGRVAIITGAGRGIGREHALLFAAEGAKVVVNDVGGANDGTGADSTPAQQVCNEVIAMGGEAVANYDSVSDWEGAQRMVNQAVETFGDLDILVNNAGILRDRVLVNMTETEWDAVVDVHMKGHFAPTRWAAAYWREQVKAGVNKPRHLVHTSSTSGLFSNPGQTNYGAAKMGLVGFTRVLAVEGARYNIKANAIAPLALTRMTENIMAGGLADVLQPGLVSPIVAYLASEECPVSGNIYSVGGGRVAEVFIGETQGYHKSDLTLEDVRDNFDQIRNRDGYAVPMGLAEETALFLPFFKS